MTTSLPAVDHNHKRPGMNDKTYFGDEQVSFKEKTERVGGVFTSVASKYDIMNDVMSFGIHRLWKHTAIARMNLRPGMEVLDLAGGTGDFSMKIAPQVGDSGRVVLSDINEAMLAVGRDRVIDAGLINQVECVVANAEELPFADNQFDRIIIAFGLRNVTQQDLALKEMLRVLRPGGLCTILEFSKVLLPGLDKAYDIYSEHVIPKMGEVITGDRESYEYFIRSIRRHPDQETLQQMMLDAGFYNAKYENLSAGIVAIHQGYKI